MSTLSDVKNLLEQAVQMVNDLGAGTPTPDNSVQDTDQGQETPEPSTPPTA